jgi:hypothetical protein
MASLATNLKNLVTVIGNDIKNLKQSLGIIDVKITNIESNITSNNGVNTNNVTTFSHTQIPNTDNIANVSPTGKTQIITKYIRNFDGVIVDVIQEEVPL